MCSRTAPAEAEERQIRDCTTETPKHRNTETPKHRNTETPKLAESERRRRENEKSRRSSFSFFLPSLPARVLGVCVLAR